VKWERKSEKGDGRNGGNLKARRRYGKIKFHNRSDVQTGSGKQRLFPWG
jgi:hypothetical protein